MKFFGGRPSAQKKVRDMFVMHKDNTIIRMFRVSKRYGKMEALSDLTLEIRNNEFVFITGPSGAGKSTMIKLLYMGEIASEGAIIIDGVYMERITRKQIPHLRRKFGVIFQDFKLIPTKTVFQNVALVLEVLGVKPKEIQVRVMEALERVGIDDRAGELPPVLSGGRNSGWRLPGPLWANRKLFLRMNPPAAWIRIRPVIFFSCCRKPMRREPLSLSRRMTNT